MRITACGIDQGIANVGHSVVAVDVNDRGIIVGELTILESGTFNTSSKQELGRRLKDINSMLSELIQKYNVNIIGCEKLFFNQKQKNNRNKSASMMNTNMVSGVIYLVGGVNNLIVRDFTPGTIKKYVAGSGRATKEDVIESVFNFCLKHGFAPETDHEADAISIAITSVKNYLDVVVPEQLKLAGELLDKLEKYPSPDRFSELDEVLGKIADFKEKERLKLRLFGVRDSLIADCRRLVAQAKAKGNDKFIEKAYKKVKRLPECSEKEAMVKVIMEMKEEYCEQN